MYVAVVDGVTVGFAACCEEVLDALYVLPEARGQGVGSWLLAALPQARQLWVLQRNDGARHFYERRGWQSRASSGQHTAPLWRCSTDATTVATRTDSSAGRSLLGIGALNAVPAAAAVQLVLVEGVSPARDQATS